jgi:hypothetical protein
MQSGQEMAVLRLQCRDVQASWLGELPTLLVLSLHQLHELGDGVAQSSQNFLAASIQKTPAPAYTILFWSGMSFLHKSHLVIVIIHT